MYRKYCVTFVCIVLVCLLAGAGVVFAVDPFNHYRADEDMTKIIYQDTFYQNLGIAKYTKYDTLITGSSMTANFRAWWFDEAFGCKAVRLSFDGGRLPDYCPLLKTAAQYNPALKTVYMSLDNVLITDDTDLKNKTIRIPSWQTDNNPLTDVNYLLNKDVLLEKTRSYFGYKKLPTYDFYEMQAWDLHADGLFSKENVLKNYSPSPAHAMLPDDYFLTPADECCAELLPVVRDNPQIQFVFFAPPYSILYWYDQLHAGKLNPTMTAIQTVYKRLLQYDNVRLFYFQDAIDQITDLDMYKDFSHYCTQYNRWMLECMQSGAHEITADTFAQTLRQAQQTFAAFDYDPIFQ